jgi:late competence protein required for DNA uptake (superfamily II DNA/RNA helicase)
MIISRSDAAVKEREKIVKAILNWSRENDKVLNIVTTPFNKCDVFEDLIFKYLKEGKTILYIVNDDIGIKYVVDILKHRSYTEYCSNIEGIKRIRENKPLVITTVDSAISVQNNYDLVIYDDISSLSKLSRLEILDLLSFFYKNSRIICRSIESVFQNAPCIEVPPMEEGIPLIEPRIITTRLDLNKEIPTVIYDYLIWSLSCQRNVIILTADEDMSARVHQYLLNIREDLFTNIFLVKDTRNKDLQYFLDKRKGIVVTHDVDIVKLKISNTDFIVYFAESRIFEYKKLVYICSKASSTLQSNLGEVILLSNDISRDMENCRDIIRRFNKHIWDMGLVKG